MVGISYFNYRKRKVSKISAGGRLRKNNQALTYLSNTKAFCVVYGYMGKVYLNKGYQRPKQKLGFRDNVLNFRKKMPNILCNLLFYLFTDYGCLNYLWKMRGYPRFSF